MDNIDQKSGNTWVHLAVIKGNVNDFSVNHAFLPLLKIKNADGLTPLSLAIVYRDIDFVKKILGFGKNAIDKSGYTAMHAACTIGNMKIYKMVSVYYVNKNLKDHSGRSPLHWAVQEDHVKIVQELVQEGANINSRDDFGINALYMAVSEGYIRIVKFLLAQENVSLRKINGETLLHVAAAWNRVDIAKLLLKRGFHGDKKDPDGITPIMLAEKHKYSVMKKVLIANEKKRK